MIKQYDDKIIFNVRISPNASSNGIVIDGEIIKIKLTAQPIENKANKALIVFLSKFLNVPKTTITIVKGNQAKDKTISVLTNDISKQKEIVLKLTK